MPPRPAEATIVAGLAADLPDVEVSGLGHDSWLVVLPGQIRWRLPVVIAVGSRTWTASVFMLRGPRPGAGAAADLHRHLLRRNRGLRLCRFWLDADDDVVLGVRLPVEAFDRNVLEAVLAELLEVAEAGFEALAHLGYPGTFPPIPRRP